MIKKIFGALIFLSLSTALAFAVDDVPLPEVILTGLQAYSMKGPEAALNAWTKGGPLENDPKVLGSVRVFQEVEKYYGRYNGYNLIRQKKLAPNSKLIYLQMNYEKGPLFIRFLCYFSGDQWVVSGRLVLNTEPDEVLN